MEPRSHPKLPLAVDGERKETVRRAGRLSYYVAGDGPPLLLVHSINAAASAYEMRPIFGQMSQKRRVYAVDLPGFGFSDRSDRRYDVALYVDSIRDMIDEIAEGHEGVPIHVTALSLSCEFVARVATEQPERFRALSLIAPTGFNRGAQHLRDPGATRELWGFAAVFEAKPWSQPLFRMLTSKKSIRYFLGRSNGSPNVDEGMVEYDYLTARQPGAHRAPLSFLTGRLFSKDIRGIYEQLTLPVWASKATAGDFQDFSEMKWAEARDHWDIVSFPAGALPHFEVPDLFFEAYRPFVMEHA